MPIEAHEEHSGVVRVVVRGKMAPDDQAALLSFVTATGLTRRIRLLIVLEGFNGWTKGEEWGDDALRLESDAAIVRAAIVGDERWKEEVFAFVARPFRAVPIEYFASERAARLWLQS